MPVYSLTTNKKLPGSTKEQLVHIVTDAHCNIMIAPEQFVHVLFTDGIPITNNKRLYIHANVRKGRAEEKIEQLCETLKTKSADLLNVTIDDIHINLLEIEAKWCMEGGYVMPSPGEEDEWMEKVTRALEERKKVSA